MDRQTLTSKIPATQPGLGAIEETIAGGIPVNAPLILSLERHRAVINAYLRGLERPIDSGGDPADVPSVASVFVSCVDTETDRRLDALGGHDELRAVQDHATITGQTLTQDLDRGRAGGEDWYWPSLTPTARTPGLDSAATPPMKEVAS